MDIHKHEVIEQCLRCLTKNGYYWNGTEWTRKFHKEPDCKDCVHFVEGDWYHDKCPDDCIEPTGLGVIKHNFVSKASGSPVNAFDGEKQDTALPNTNSLLDRVRRHGEICKELTDLYERKNHDYGDSFHKTFVEEGFAMARIRLSDKLERFKSLSKGAEQKVNDESIIDTLKDMANYAIMTVIEIERG
jgi:hypothetical protein